MPRTMARNKDDLQDAIAVLNVLGEVPWEATAIARGYVSMVKNGKTLEEAAKEAHDRGLPTFKKSKEVLERAASQGFNSVLTPRRRLGSAENPITKLFPAAITEQRFLELLDQLDEQRESLDYEDDREAGHTLTDFTITEDELRLPINIKNAGTRFERAADLVGLEPDNCIPIPAYKAHAAINTVPNLLYVVAQDYGLIGKLNEMLPKLFTEEETRVWRLLNECNGSRLRRAEDAFVGSIVRRHWGKLRSLSVAEFHAISARKAIRLLHTKPKRTPGIGMRAWGTTARGEVNVHVSIREDMTDWGPIQARIREQGVSDIVDAVNRKKREWVYDPEI
jgi:hypothetical protein